MTRWFTAAGLVLLAVGASAALWRAPGTFPLATWAWWASTGLVLGTWLLVVVAVLAAWLERPALRLGAWLVPAGLLCGVALSGRLLFPATTPRFRAGVLLLGVAWAASSVRSFQALDARGRALALGGLLLGAPWGVGWSLARRPAPPGTRPSLAVLPPPGPSPTPGSGERLRVPCGPAMLLVSPLLVFMDSSRDGFWPGVAPTALEGAPPLEGARRRAALAVEPLDGGARIEAATEVPAAVHSHLNRYTDVELEGVARPVLRFPAVGPGTFEVRPFDYPRGRPVRFATLLPDGELLVAEATDAEKGPFVALGRGALPRGAPLVIEVLDGEAPRCTLTFLDFTAQADVSRSPTAGEGVPVNVVQFGVPAREGALPWLHLSLAETGLGAGRDTVTHAPGVYANRLLVTPASAR